MDKQDLVDFLIKQCSDRGICIDEVRDYIIKIGRAEEPVLVDYMGNWSIEDEWNCSVIIDEDILDSIS